MQWKSKSAILGLLCVVISCERNKEPKEKVTSEPSSKKEGDKGKKGRGGGAGRGPQAVEVFKAVTQDLPNTLAMPVVLEGRRQVEVYPRVSGRVQKILKGTGESVARGGALFAIDRAEPGESFLSVPVTSPIAGKVAQWFVAEGDQLSSGERALLVVDDSALRAKLWLPVPDWQQVNEKTKVTLTIDGKVKESRIVTVAGAVQPTAGKGLIEVEIPNASGDWKAGFSAEARIETALRPRMIVPARALLLTSDGAFVYLVEDGVARRKKIDFVPRTADDVEIKAGILPEETLLVVSGAGRLSDGAQVQIADAEGAGKKREKREKRSEADGRPDKEKETSK
jgi:multidrug efflux pump subunit AcrA (membrane-fusion protein)